MSNTDPVTHNPNVKMPAGRPLESDEVVPDWDGTTDDGALDDVDGDETMAGGLEYPDDLPAKGSKS